MYQIEELPDLKVAWHESYKCLNELLLEYVWEVANHFLPDYAETDTGMIPVESSAPAIFANRYAERNLSVEERYLSETQFAQVVGRMRMYQALSPTRQKAIPRLLITDSQINSVCRDYYTNEVFGMKDNAISLFDFHNLLTQSNKNSYIDSYLQRGVNATEVSVGLNNVLQGLDNKYSWFLG